MRTTKPTSKKISDSAKQEIAMLAVDDLIKRDCVQLIDDALGGKSRYTERQTLKIVRDLLKHISDD
jgi:hypothetical protein